MTMADVDRIVEIAASLPTAPHWPAEAYATAMDPEAMRRRIALVAASQASGTVYGFAVASLTPPEAELESIAVAEEAQRRGIACCLFAALVDRVKSAGITEVILEVRPSNLPALQLYKALGFHQAARRARYYADPVEDALLLTLPVS